MARTTCICWALFLFVAGLASAQEPAREWRSYGLAAGGTVLLEVPAGWKEEIRQQDGASFPAIVLRPGKKLELLFTPMRPADGQMPPLATLEASLIESGSPHLAGAVQDSITLEALESGAVVGRYYRLTEKQPPPGEYPSVIAGALIVGPIVGSFTVLTHDPDGDEAREALRILCSATFEPPGRAGVYRATLDDLRLKVGIAQLAGMPVETLTDEKKLYEVRLADHVLKATVAKGGTLSIRIDGGDPDAAAELLHAMTIGFEKIR
jgi:hypothetical protein